MLFLAVLLVMYSLTWLLPRHRLHRQDRWRLALAAAMTVAGLSHLFAPTPFLQHLPAWTPYPETIVLLSGLAEIGLGVALLLPQPSRHKAGLLLAVFLVAVFPANIYVAVAGIEVDGQPGGIYPWLRLGLQPAFVWLAIWATREPIEQREHGVVQVDTCN